VTRDLFARHALQNIPKILTLQDRNPHSPTYGCFDRNFWQYRIIDFPSGMSQEFVWPLALAYSLDLPGNPFFRQPAVRDWAIAGIRFASSSAHPDGSCDDYFPYERAAGATAFSLLACIESYEVLDLTDDSLLAFMARRADWLADHQESGRLTNHHALIALCLGRLSDLLQTGRWQKAMDERVAQVLDWQTSEGWFPEYEGCDPGYHTLTISCLAQLLERAPTDNRLREALTRAVDLAGEFIHPDGSFGGEYGSRNTLNFFPHGFEVVGRWLPKALHINDGFIRGMAAGLVPAYEDDHLIGHHTWNYLLAWRDFVSPRPAAAPRRSGRVVFGQAGILIDRRNDAELYLALNKGGVFKVFRGGRLVASDTQISLLVRRGGRVQNAVGHLVGKYDVEEGPDEIVIRGRLGWAKHTQMNPSRLIMLRGAMLAGGRLFPDLVRRTLQRVLITGRADAPFRFVRRIRWESDRWHVRDEVSADEDWTSVAAAGLGGAQTSIYVVMSRVFQSGQMEPWRDLTAEVAALRPGEPLEVARAF